jgi:iron complex transport system permease protein
MAVGIGGLVLVRWRLNVLSLGDQEARSLGVNADRMRIAVIAFATVMTAAAVSVSGVIGWVGLVIPHVARMLVGPDHRALVPASVAIGGSYLLLIDSLARSATTAEIPLSILTAVIGAPFFAFLLRRTGEAWS